MGNESYKIYAAAMDECEKLMISKMLDSGLPIEQVAQITGKSISEIQEIQNN